ncbi:carbonic anhydrase [Candidatus Binatia bacterium]|nr:carbonic anhydrase [Candidatus Binatia bacterium]
MSGSNETRDVRAGECPSGSPPDLGRRSLLRGALAALPVAAGLTLNLGCGDGSSSNDDPGPPPQPQNPQEALQLLVEGNQRWVDQKPRIRSTAEIEQVWTDTPKGQAPFASVLGCADSRLAPELIFDQFIGDIFVVREAGNIATSPTNLGSLEFGYVVLGSQLVLVLGHTSCGAVNAAFTNATPPGHIQAIVDAIKPGIVGAETLEEATDDNVRAVIQNLRDSSSILRQAEIGGEIAIVGGVYDLATGVVRLL